MQTRTRLTTPPGEEPAPPPSARPTQGSADGEAYVPGFALPREPAPPSRYRKPIALTTVVVLLLVAGWAILQIVTAGEDFDPAVGDNPGVPAPAELPDGGEGGTEGDATDG